MAAMVSVGAADAAARPSTAAVSEASLWEEDWDDDKDHVGRPREEQQKAREMRSATPIESNTAVVERWDMDDEHLEERLDDLLAKKKKITMDLLSTTNGQRSDTLLQTRQSCVDSVGKGEVACEDVSRAERSQTENRIDPISKDEVACEDVSRAERSQTENRIDQRFRGTVRFFKGCQGWVTSEGVKTDRSVNPQGHSWTAITNAIYIHKNDCKSVLRYGMDVTFRVEHGTNGSLKCVDVRPYQEDAQWDLDTYKKMRAMQNNRLKNESECKVVASESSSAPSPASVGILVARKQPSNLRQLVRPRKPSRSQFKEQVVDSKSSDSHAKGGFQVWQEAREQVSNKPQQSVQRSKAKFNDAESVSSSTDAGTTSCSASVISVADEQDQFSVLQNEMKWEDRPRYATFPVGTAASHIDIEELEQAHPEEEDGLDQDCVADNWEEADLDALDLTLEAKRADLDDAIEEQDARCPSLASKGPDCADRVEPSALDQVSEPQVNLSTTPQKGGLEQFCAAHGLQCHFDFVSRHLGDDFETIVRCTSDKSALDSLIQAGMKPLIRNKFYRALLEEKEQRAARRETSVPAFADFLAKVGPEFDIAFVARNLGTDSLEEVVTFTDLDHFECLVVAGMKPLHKNKLFRALALERMRRARHR